MTKVEYVLHIGSRNYILNNINTFQVRLNAALAASH